MLLEEELLYQSCRSDSPLKKDAQIEMVSAPRKKNQYKLEESDIAERTVNESSERPMEKQEGSNKKLSCVQIPLKSITNSP